MSCHKYNTRSVSLLTCIVCTGQGMFCNEIWRPTLLM